MKSYIDFDCEQEWTAFVVPFRKREEHLPHFLKAISKHQLKNSQNNVSDSLSIHIYNVLQVPKDLNGENFK